MSNANSVSEGLNYIECKHGLGGKISQYITFWLGSHPKCAQDQDQDCALQYDATCYLKLVVNWG